jgi:uncharacterized protein YecE (DUF72 family)
MSGQTFFIGTSGWNYKHWIGKFYPEDLSVKEWFNYYKDRFSTVELNTSFYHLPKRNTFEKWRINSPDNFIYSVKASRYITHVKKMIEPEEPVKKFFESAEALKEKTGPILFQLPPGWKYNDGRFKEFLSVLPKNYKYTFEFRNETWWNDEVLSLLKDNNAAFCMFELAGVRTPQFLTADFAYIRLHGPGGKYQGSYNDDVLRSWANDFLSWDKTIKEVYCYFDNDDSAFAVYNAMRLKELLEEKEK